MKAPCLSQLLKQNKIKNGAPKKSSEELIEKLQLQMLRIEQGVWHSKGRAIVLFEGFDAAGKGGAIRRITEKLDPRSFRVHPVGPPTSEEAGKHYLYRFWRDLPDPGTIAIFDRSWYGRVLVERVDKLIPKERWQQAYEEINQFEAMLTNDGIDVVKIFLSIHKNEQIQRFEARLHDPYKQWKLTPSDVQAHRQWTAYVKAADDLLRHTHTTRAPWHLIPADSKEHARIESLRTVIGSLSHYKNWMEQKARKKNQRDLRRELNRLEKV
jgi:AMP-polyphosphate phosphotransferase